MSKLMQSVDDRTQLAGTNRIEILLFSLGRDPHRGHEEIFGINVFKVREVMQIPEITRAPDMSRAIEGMVSLRGSTIPVINLIRYCGFESENESKIMIVTEYNNHVQGFVVDSVDNIERMAWQDIKTPPTIMDSQHGGLITAVTEIEGKGLVMIMDVEKVLAEATGLYQENGNEFGQLPKIGEFNFQVVFADDSYVAREQIKRTLDAMGIRYHSAENGLEAWNKLDQIAATAELNGADVSQQVNLVLTDIEMPEMDGYVLTRKIKQDSRLKHIPVIMHSSLSTDANKKLGENVGVDAYVPKFNPGQLADTIVSLLPLKAEAS